MVLKNIRTGTSDSKLLVFFETGFDNVEYNASIARCIEKVLKKNSDGINVRYIPLTNDAINAKSVAELEKLYQQGEFTDITEKSSAVSVRTEHFHSGSLPRNLRRLA